MNEHFVQEGSNINIRRTNGNIQTAVVVSIDYTLNCAKVEWVENGEIKGKDVHLDGILALNPYLLLKPIEDANLRPSTASDRYINANRPQRNDISVLVAPSKSRMEVKGRSIFSTYANESEPISRYTDITLRTVNNMEANRMLRRKKQAEIRAQRSEIAKKHRDQPHWETSQMISDVREQIAFDTLSENDPIEDHLITVAVRKRPLNRAEIMKKEIDIVTVPNKTQVLIHEPKVKVDLTKYLEKHMFTFDYALNESCSNNVVYKYTAKPLIQTIFDGGFATCFAYGQTGSGKTFTMSGTTDKKEKGIYALSTADIFRQVNSSKYLDYGFRVSCSFFEIYGKQVFDLLNNKQRLKVLEDGQQQVQIVGLTETSVISEDEILELISSGSEERASGQTSSNFQSSRSHAIFQIMLRRQSSPKVIHGKLSLIDLAGNERGADTSSSSRTTRLEGAEINQSLLCLKECIRALGRKDSYLPFRTSKLTQVLRDSFIGAKTKTCMIAMISPGIHSCENTLNTLRYADRVKDLGKGELGDNCLSTDDKCPPHMVNRKVNVNLMRQNKELIQILQDLTYEVVSLDSYRDDPENYTIQLKAITDCAISLLQGIRKSLDYC